MLCNVHCRRVDCVNCVYCYALTVFDVWEMQLIVRRVYCVLCGMCAQRMDVYVGSTLARGGDATGVG